MERVKIFLSYNTIDKKLVGKIKNNLNGCGIDVFLAHEDIEPTQDWTNRILVELNKSDIFLPVLTKNFKKSKWTSQEIGIALANKLFIISLKIDVDPFGFLSRYQALKFKAENIDQSCLRIIKIFNKEKRLRKKFLDGLISNFEKSNSFDDAKNKSELLNKFDGYTKAQITKILRTAIENNQILLSWGAERRLKELFNLYQNKIDNALLKKYMKLLHQ